MIKKINIGSIRTTSDSESLMSLCTVRNKYKRNSLQVH